MGGGWGAHKEVGEEVVPRQGQSVTLSFFWDLTIRHTHADNTEATHIHAHVIHTNSTHTHMYTPRRPQPHTCNPGLWADAQLRRSLAADPKEKVEQSSGEFTT